MKQLFLLLCLACGLPLTAQDTQAKAAGEGMVFVEKPFEDLLAQAKAENKIIFIDAYTTWCGPCKMMASQIFPKPEVGAVYNERFINAKIDMEKGEGPELARRYSVMAYPTYLFVDGNGDIVHKGIGYIPAEPFLALADAATSDNSLGAMNKRYAAGERSGEFMGQYAQVLTEVYEQEKAGKVAEEYLSGVEDWSDPATLNLLISNPGEPGGKRMNYLFANLDAVEKEMPLDEFSMMMQQNFIMGEMKKRGSRDMPSVADMRKVYKAHAGPLAGRMGDYYAMFLPERTGDYAAYVPAAIKYVDKYGSENFSELNSVAWTIFENSEDKAQLQKALGYAKKSVGLNKNYANMDTLAWLYHKTGDKKMAKETAAEAIEIAKATGQDYSDTARILEE